MRPTASKEWASLSAYESPELVRRFAKEREIAAHFSQGREYFRSAAGAGELVRLLILCYGAMSLARGTVLFLDPASRKSQRGTASTLPDGEGWVPTRAPYPRCR